MQNFEFLTAGRGRRIEPKHLSLWDLKFHQPQKRSSVFKASRIGSPVISWVQLPFSSGEHAREMFPSWYGQVLGQNVFSCSMGYLGGGPHFHTVEERRWSSYREVRCSNTLILPYITPDVNHQKKKKKIQPFLILRSEMIRLDLIFQFSFDKS